MLRLGLSQPKCEATKSVTGQKKAMNFFTRILETKIASKNLTCREIQHCS